MCNLYSITTNQEAIHALFRVVNRYVGNLAPMPVQAFSAPRSSWVSLLSHRLKIVQVGRCE
jgi:hypothetical protein